VLIKLHVAISQWVYDLETREEGQTLVEYGLILAFVSVVAVLALTNLGTKITSLISQVISGL
jgi:Flp pilus assembly pilin Flp